MWDLKRESSMGSLRGHAASVLDLHVDPKTNYVVSVDRAGVARMWVCVSP